MTDNKHEALPVGIEWPTLPPPYPPGRHRAEDSDSEMVALRQQLRAALAEEEHRLGMRSTR